MEQEPRKASEVLLALETKIDQLLGVVRNQDLKIGIISNKLNAAMELIRQKSSTPVTAPSFSMEAADEVFPSYQNKEIPVSSEDALPQENSPKGFRRTSRPEGYAGDNAMPLPKPKAAPKPPPGRAEVFVPPQAVAKTQPVEIQAPPPLPVNQEQIGKNSVPVMQRVVDRNGKSVFLADVEIIDLTTSQPIFKTRTNGTGKWMASLVPGHYKVLIRKVESLTKERVETPQEITVDGLKSPLDLPTLIIK